MEVIAFRMTLSTGRVITRERMESGAIRTLVDGEYVELTPDEWDEYCDRAFG